MKTFPASNSIKIKHTPIGSKQKKLNYTEWALFYHTTPPTISRYFKEFGTEGAFERLEVLKDLRINGRPCQIKGCTGLIPTKAPMSAKYCSDECVRVAQQYYYQRSKKRKQANAVDTPCKVCKKLFPKWQRDQTCCSTECGNKYRAQQSARANPRGKRPKWKIREHDKCNGCADYNPKCLDLLCSGKELPKNKDKCFIPEDRSHLLRAAVGAQLGNNGGQHQIKVR